MDYRVCIQDNHSCQERATQEHGRRREEIIPQRGAAKLFLFFYLQAGATQAPAFL
jgi:hypothetical protein